MDLYEWISLLLVGALFGVPFAVGLCVSSVRRAMLLAMASFAGLYASIWSTRRWPLNWSRGMNYRQYCF
jgi:hypothetical protein